MNRKLLFLFFSLLFFIACNSDDAIDEPSGQIIPWGEATAQWGDREMEFVIYGIQQKEDALISIHLDNRDSSNTFNRYITLSNIPYVLGSYELLDFNSAKQEDKANSLYSAGNGDAIIAEFNVLETDSTNFISLTDIEASSQEIKGDFQATFVIDPSFSDVYLLLEDTLRLTNGYFNTRVN